MKTQSLLRKYRKLLNILVGQKSGAIQFQVSTNGGEYVNVGEIAFIKPKKTIYHDWLLGNYRVILSPELEPAPSKLSWSDPKRLTEEANRKAWLKNHVISTFKLYQMPHCCGIMVSCNAFVGEPFRKKGIGTLLNSLRQDIGRQLGYSLILCTDIEKNEPQRKLLKTNGWKEVYSFLNKRTNNKVYISVVGI